MKESKYITKCESKILQVFSVLIFFLTFISISSKLINGYNRAIKEEFFKLERAANDSPSFWISDCYHFNNHPALFTLFLFFIFLVFLSASKTINSSFLSIIAFASLILSLLQATYLSIWFAEVVRIEWNSTLILSDIFDAVLYFCFAIILIVQLKIIYRFTIEKLHAKIS